MHAFQKMGRLLTFPGLIIGLSLVATLIISIHSFYKPVSDIQVFGLFFPRTGYNNFDIFKQSYVHLLQDQNLYQYYPNQHWDLFKYSPTFALLMAPFYWLPTGIGLFLWNLLNIGLFLIGLYALPRFPLPVKGAVFWMVSFELFGSMQNAQSNAMILGLILLGFALLERNFYFWAVGCLMATVYIKLFGLVAFSLLLFYPGKGKLAGYTILWALLLFVIPLPFIGWEALSKQYLNWQQLLLWDHSESIGLSVMGWMEAWFGWVAKTEILLAGIVLFCLPLLRFSAYSNYPYRLLGLASVLIWVIIFNHRAESATFIIAIAGVAIWYFTIQPHWTDHFLLAASILFMSLAYSDLFPPGWREGWVKPWVLKGLIPSLVWFKLVWQQGSGRFKARGYLAEADQKTGKSEPYLNWNAYKGIWAGQA